MEKQEVNYINIFGDFQQFFQDYKSSYNKMVQDDLIYYSTILEEVGMITENGLKEEEVLTSNYNIFNILKVEKYEDKTHTLILLDLFDIKGIHRQKDLFYKLLIEQLILPRLSFLQTRAGTMQGGFRIRINVTGERIP